MHKEEYAIELQQAHFLARLIVGLRSQEMVQLIGRAESIGPILDPTLYRAKSETMGEDKAVLQALASCKGALLSAGVRPLASEGEAAD